MKLSDSVGRRHQKTEEEIHVHNTEVVRAYLVNAAEGDWSDVTAAIEQYAYGDFAAWPEGVLDCEDDFLVIDANSTLRARCAGAQAGVAVTADLGAPGAEKAERVLTELGENTRRYDVENASQFFQWTFVPYLEVAN